ncbi:MAG TPA: hypothetical protein VKB80_07330 [Kofleriaceae bacterium]|nr:hypothetical protein [Kofleriaceae bacterium]
MTALTASRFALWHLEHEARGLLSRLGRVRSFALQETMVPAASLTVEAQSAIERFLTGGRRALRRQVRRFLAWIATPEARAAAPAEAQRRFTLLRLRFNVVLSHFDIFSEALSQRSEAENGVWLAGLDVAARDALELPGVMEAPPVVCYLARGPGAAIRRARTRLPGGAQNPVAIIRMPRERMVGSGIASSLVHEVGHQGAALLDLVASLRAAMPAPAGAWSWWRLWISEIVADLWSVARLGAASTVGLIGVVSLPSPFVFRITPDDPHPPPYLRVKLSAAVGEALYPHPQWRRLVAMWESFYDVARLPPHQRAVYAELEASLPAFVAFLVGHRPPRLGGPSLGEALPGRERHPARLAEAFASWQERPALLRRAAPTLAFAGLGQARLDGLLEPEDEGDLVASLLRHWAWRATVDVSEVCAAMRRPAAAASPPRLPRLPRLTVVPRLAANHGT